MELSLLLALTLAARQSHVAVGGTQPMSYPRHGMMDGLSFWRPLTTVTGLVCFWSRSEAHGGWVAGWQDEGCGRF